MSDQGHPSWMPPPSPPGWQPQQPPGPPQVPSYGAPPHEAAGWYAHGGYGYPRPQDTNGFAIASLVCSLLGILLAVVGPTLGIVFGAVGLKQIPRLGQSGRGLAIAGLTIGIVVLLLDVIVIIAAIATGSGSVSTGVNV